MHVIVHGKKFGQSISALQIEERIKEISIALNEKYREKRPVFMAILNGAFIFAADVVRKFDSDCEIEFIKLRSYHGTNSTGKVEMDLPPQIDLRGRHVVLLEDIVDSGLTLGMFLPILEALEPASIEIVALLVKPEVLQNKVKVDITGFEIPNQFVIGYGLDFDGIGRNLGDIYALIE
jgi:hypoxanthine phosphoribosyltransferase